MTFCLGYILGAALYEAINVINTGRGRAYPFFIIAAVAAAGLAIGYFKGEL